MSQKVRLLIVGQQEIGQQEFETHGTTKERLVTELVRAGFAPEWSRVDTVEGLIQGLYPKPEVVLCEHRKSGLDALEVLAVLQRQRVDRPVIVVAEPGDEEFCIRALRQGAVDYLLTDRLARLGPAIEQARANRRLASDKRAAERQERATAGLLRGLVEHAPTAISVKSVDGSYLLANRQFEALCGVGPGAMIGRLDADVFPVPQAREMIELDARCLHDRVVLEREVVLGPELSGSPAARDFLAVRYPVLDDAGEVFGIGAIYLDITRQKRLETNLTGLVEDLLVRRPVTV